jgi:hypothetical protein
MAEIATNIFNGGINNVVESHLLAPNFSKDLRNCRIQNGAISSANAPKILQDIPDEGLIYQDGSRSLIKFGGNYYWSDNDTGELDSSLGYLGVPNPKTKATARAGEAGGRFTATKTYKYIYTFITADGFRSAPYSTTDVTIFVPSYDLGTVILTGIDPSMPDYVSDIEFWRTVGDGLVYYRAGSVDRWANAGDIEFEDDATDAEILLNEQYDLATAAGRPNQGRYLTERNSVFYLADGDKLYFSEQSNPHAYDQLNYITFDDNITGTISTETYTLVFTRNRAYQITGNSAIDIAKQEIPDSQGVKNWQTVGRVKNMPLWVSNDGLCAYQPYDNRSGRKISVLTDNIFNLPDGPLSAQVANDVYYLFYEDETIAFDFVENMKVYKLDWKFDWAWYDKDDDILVGKKASVYYDAGGGDVYEWEYLSPEFVADDMHKLKQFGRMVADSDSDLDITFYADGLEVWNYKLPHKGIDNRREFISPLVEGRRIQVKIKSTGTLRGISYEFIIRRL